MSIKIQMNKTVKGIEKLRIYLRAVSKFGKTTLFRDVVLEEFNGDATKGLLVGVNNEIGYTLLDELQTTHCNSWKELKELQTWLIKEKGKEHDIKLVAFDTIDELVPLAEKEVMRLSQIQTGKPCDSINKALGGYNAGRNKVKEIIKEYFTTLYKAGFGVFAISHTKLKTIVEKGKDESEGYQVLTSNLENSYECIFADIFDCVLTGTIEKTIDSKKITGEERRLYMRGNGYVDAGCRFAPDSVPEYIVYEGNFARKFIDTLEEGLRKSKTNPVSKEEFKKEQAKEVKELENKLPEEEEPEPALNKVEAVNTIKANISKLNFADVQNVMKKHGFANFNNPDEIPEEGLLEILKMIK